MFDSYATDLLRTGIIEAKAGNSVLARRYLERAIYAAYNSDHQFMSEAWYWLSQVLPGTSERRTALENALLHDWRHPPARRALAVLDGKLRPEEIVNPDRLPPPPKGVKRAGAQRFMCPKCGGRMAFAPDGQRLVCEYCTRPQPVGVGTAPTADKDFILALATLPGHRRPLNDKVFACRGCGAQFILTPGQLSAVCAYCGSPHVLSLAHAKDLLAPDVILPQAFDARRASSRLADWVKGNRLRLQKAPQAPRGLYLPAWAFEVGGSIDYTGEAVKIGPGFPRGETQTRRVHDQLPVIPEKVLIPGSRKLSAILLRLLPGFDLQMAKAYDPAYLAGWRAELYDISLAEASLDARSQAYVRIKEHLPRLLGSVRLLTTSSASLTVESFQLILLPVWLTEVWYGGRAHLVLLDGISGAVQAELPAQSTGAIRSRFGPLRWLRRAANDA